ENAAHRPAVVVAIKPEYPEAVARRREFRLHLAAKRDGVSRTNAEIELVVRHEVGVLRVDERERRKQGRAMHRMDDNRRFTCPRDLDPCHASPMLLTGKKNDARDAVG